MPYLLHPLVDFCTVVTLIAGGFTIERWLVYNAIAFALQFPLGVVIDMLGVRWRRICFVAGCAMVFVGAAMVQLGGWIPLAIGCLGNALFHLTAGVWVMEAHPGKSGAIGLFISTGAIGLTAGHHLAMSGHVYCVWPVACLLLLLAVAFGRAASMTPPSSDIVAAGGADQIKLPALCPLGVVVLMGLIIWRGWYGFRLNTSLTFNSIGTVVAVAAAMFFGKAFGGLAADRLNVIGIARPRLIVTAAAIVGTVALLVVSDMTSAFAVFAMLFVTQLTTGPVLSLLSDSLGRRSGVAFGLNSFGLFAGSVI